MDDRALPDEALQFDTTFSNAAATAPRRRPAEQTRRLRRTRGGHEGENKNKEKDKDEEEDKNEGDKDNGEANDEKRGRQGQRRGERRRGGGRRRRMRGGRQQGEGQGGGQALEFVLSTCIQASPRPPRNSAAVRTAFK